MDANPPGDFRPYADKSIEQLLALAEWVESHRRQLAREQELIRDELLLRNINVTPESIRVSIPQVLVPPPLAYSTPPFAMLREIGPGDPYVAAARRSGIAAGIIAAAISLVGLLIVGIIAVGGS